MTADSAPSLRGSAPAPSDDTDACHRECPAHPSWLAGPWLPHPKIPLPPLHSFALLAPRLRQQQSAGCQVSAAVSRLQLRRTGSESRTCKRRFRWPRRMRPPGTAQDYYGPKTTTKRRRPREKAAEVKAAK